MANEKTNGQLPTIDIKGKDYVLVKDRVLFFNKEYPNGAIQTQRIITEEQWVELFKAVVTPDCDKPERYFTWYSQAKWWEWFINKTAALENAETSAVGRALAMMWIWVIDSIASADEVIKAEWGKKEEKKVEKKEESGEKPWFNEPDLTRLRNNVEYLKKFSNSDDLIKDIEKHYRISKDKKIDIADVWSDVE